MYHSYTLFILDVQKVKYSEEEVTMTFESELDEKPFKVTTNEPLNSCAEEDEENIENKGFFTEGTCYIFMMRTCN